jgi:N utilization substance protein A
MSGKNELLLALEQLEKDKNIDKEDIFAVIENALVSAYKKHAGRNVNASAIVDRETGEMSACVLKTIVKNIENPVTEISLSDARKYDEEAEIGKEVRIPLDPQDFARIAAQTAKQVIVQKIRESEKNVVMSEMRKKIGQIVNGTVYKTFNKTVIVDLGKTEGILPHSEQVPKENFTIGQHIKTVVVRINEEGKSSGVVLSRTSPDLVKRLFEIEVPEIYEKIVEIRNIVREPGIRTKISVVSHNPKVDAVGACVGIKGARVKPIIDELRGERIDLTAYTDDVRKYIAGSLSPAKVGVVNIISEKDKRAEVIVADDVLSLAIGKNGHNIRLAARLTGWHIDAKSESQKCKEDESGKMELE